MVETGGAHDGVVAVDEGGGIDVELALIARPVGGDGHGGEAGLGGDTHLVVVIGVGALTDHGEPDGGGVIVVLGGGGVGGGVADEGSDVAEGFMAVPDEASLDVGEGGALAEVSGGVETVSADGGVDDGVVANVGINVSGDDGGPGGEGRGAGVGEQGGGGVGVCRGPCAEGDGGGEEGAERGARGAASAGGEGWRMGLGNHIQASVLMDHGCGNSLLPHGFGALFPINGEMPNFCGGELWDER